MLLIINYCYSLIHMHTAHNVLDSIPKYLALIWIPILFVAMPLVHSGMVIILPAVDFNNCVVTGIEFFPLAPMNSPPPKRQRIEQQARQEIKQQTSTRGNIICA